jgi:hypothetical protein
MNVGDWFGLATLVVVVAVSVWTAFHTSGREGKRKVAEARLKWNDRFQELAAELHDTFREIERLDSLKRYPISRRRNLDKAQKLASELLIMINPDSADEAGRQEAKMETYLVSRLASFGRPVDLEYIRTLRVVLKRSWQKAKAEF